MLSIRRSCQQRKRTLEFAETGGCIFASYDACLIVVCSLFGLRHGCDVSRRNRESSGWLWTSAAPTSSSVLPESVALHTAASFTKLEIQPGRRSIPCSSTSWRLLPDRTPGCAPNFFLFVCGGEAGTRDHVRGRGCRSTTRRPSFLNSGLCRWGGRMHLLFARRFLRTTCRGSSLSPLCCRPRCVPTHKLEGFGTLYRMESTETSSC